MEQIIVRAEGTSHIDLLGRQEFVDDVLNVMESFSKRGKSASYAINGVWGCGKSYVLDQIYEQAENIFNSKENDYRYYLFRYNCWEYDYYEEPLVSLVTAMIQTIEEETHLFDATVRETAIYTLKKIGKSVLRKGLDYVKDKTGIDVNQIVDTATGVYDEAKEQVKEKTAFDQLVPLKNALQDLNAQIEELSKKRTVVFLVDELDRCLPEYAIRVLERLHHIFEGIDNVQIIFSIDRSQLEHVVKQIYGESTNTSSYLKKFMQFELTLPLGSVNDAFGEMFKSFVGRFSGCSDEENMENGLFIKHILDGFDVRKRISLIEKAELVHDLEFADLELSEQDMCVELFLVVLDDCLKKADQSDEKADKSLSSIQRLSDRIPSERFPFPDFECFDYLYEMLKRNTALDGSTIHDYDSIKISYRDNTLYGRVLCAYLTVLGKNDCVHNVADEQAIRAERIWHRLESLQ